MTSDMLLQAIEHYKERTGFERLQPRAALIDMDGTLLDSMARHTAAWHRMATELGIQCSREEFYLYEGMTGAETINRLFRRAFGHEATDSEKVELYARKSAYFNELPRADVMPGAQQMVVCLKLFGVERVLVTGSGQLSNLERLKTDFPGGFSDALRVTSGNVRHCKPHPEPYLTGMSLAGVEPWQSIAVENAPLGVRSASDAGAFTVAVTTGPIPEPEMWKSGADIVFASMPAFAKVLPALLRICGLEERQPGA